MRSALVAECPRRGESLEIEKQNLTTEARRKAEKYGAKWGERGDGGISEECRDWGIRASDIGNLMGYIGSGSVCPDQTVPINESSSRGPFN